MSADIPALLQRLGITAKKRGRDWWASCPLPQHGGADSTPSWRIRDDDSEKHGFHVCYGCGGGGGVLALVMAMANLETVGEARDWLGTDLDVPMGLPRIEIVERTLRAGFKLPPGVRFTPMSEWPEPPRRYLLQRGVTDHQVDRWSIGYAVDGSLSGRVVIPVHGIDGRLGAYVGRAFTGSIRRYDEPTEEDGADLGIVFGEQHWPALRDRAHVFVAEGTFDGLALERVMGGAIAALRGSQLNQQKIASLSTFCSATVVTDPDRAGDAAAEEIRMALGRWCQVKRAVLPSRVDAAKLAVEAPAELRARVLNAGPSSSNAA